MILIPLNRRIKIVLVKLHPCQVVSKIMTGNAIGPAPTMGVKDRLAGFGVADREPLVQGDGLLGGVDSNAVRTNESAPWDNTLLERISK